MNSTLINDIKAESDVDLVAAVSLQADDNEVAMLALQELHTRYSSICLFMAIKQEQFGIDPDSVVSKTFEKVWHHADNFDSERRAKGVAKENAVRNWITTILANQIKDEIRARSIRPEIPLLQDGFSRAKENGSSEIDDDDADFDAVGDYAVAATDCDDSPHRQEDGVQPRPKLREMLDVLMSQLTEKECQILLLSASYVEPNPPFKCRIPQDQLASLAMQVGVAPASIKVLRQRAFIKLRKMAEQSPNLPAKL